MTQSTQPADMWKSDAVIDKYEALRKALAAGPTPGRRAIHRHAETAVVSESGRVIATTGGSASTLPEDADLPAKQAADARLIAACDHATLTSLLADADRARELEAAFSAACAFIDSHAADPDITPEMCRAYEVFLERRAAIDRAQGETR